MSDEAQKTVANPAVKKEKFVPRWYYSITSSGTVFVKLENKMEFFGKMYGVSGWFYIDSSTNLPIKSTNPITDFNIQFEREAPYYISTKIPKSVIKKLSKMIVVAANEWQISPTIHKSFQDKLSESLVDDDFIDVSKYSTVLCKFLKDSEEWNQRKKQRFNKDMNINDYISASAEKIMDVKPDLNEYLSRVGIRLY